MGGQFSKRREEVLPVFQRPSNLQSRDSTLQVGTSTNPDASADEIPEPSFDSRIEITGTSPHQVNQQVVRGFLNDNNHKIDAWKDQELSRLVKDFCEKSLQNLDSCKAMEQCLMKARHSQSILKENPFSEEKLISEEKLNIFKAAENPYSKDFIRLLKTLLLRKDILDKKRKSVKTRRKVLSIIFGIIFIPSAAVAAIKAPNVVSAMAAVVSLPLGTVRKWFNSLATDKENALDVQMKLISSIHAGTFLAINDLKAIGEAAGCLSEEIQTLEQNIDIAPREVEEIEKKLGVLLKNLEVLTEKCSQNIEKAITVVLERVSKHANS